MANDISGWLLQSGTEPNVAFGHAQYLAKISSNATIWNHLLEPVTTSHPVIIVAPPYEIPVIRATGQSLGLQENFTTFTYQGFLDFVEKERRGAGRGPDVWPRVSESDRLVVMVAIEPHMPTDCALSLTMIVHWAADRPSGLSMRILTVSTQQHHPEVTALLRWQSMPEPRRFLLEIAQDQVRRVKLYCGDKSDLVERVKPNVARKDGSQAIVLFTPEGPSQELADYLHTLGWPSTKISRSTPSSVLQLALAAAEEDENRILHVEEWFRSPFPITGFDHVHVVANSTSTKVIFDAVTGQLTSTLVQLSKQERKEQVACAYRSQGAFSVSLYIDRPTANEFLQAGIKYRRLQVNNEHLGGFIAALASFEGWGINALSVAACFAPDMEDDALIATRKRLIDQGLLRQSLETNCLGLQVRDKEADVFKAVLPILNYDHRLAYLVAQRTDNMILRRSKLQLASLLAVGISDVFLFPLEMSEDLDALASKCWGYTRPLAKQGAMWMALGLWKRAAHEYHDFQTTRGILPQHLAVPETPIDVSLGRSAQVVFTMKRLTNALHTLHIGSIDIPIAEESGELDEDGCLELQTHLFMAFLGQLVVGSSVNGKCQWRDIASDTVLLGLQHWVELFVNPDELHKTSGKTVIWGIYNGLVRRDRDTWAGDWAWVPGSVVAEYWYRRGTEASLLRLLRGHERTLQNVDEALE
ncbi:hypothetical protein N0V84_003574 [Fusarium piperis]|uniref:Uncharacterized protein n=1 Tax=Fusarium piperis TaxID=1435070 RepID=A0A9W8WHE7_9HYPO|nr:hypothetical protein N0V84_003574 [Fusarium piperis]